MSNQEQQATTAADAAPVRVGFEALLDIYIPTWRENQNAPEVRNAIEFARAVYSRGLDDAAVFANNAIRNLHEGYAWLVQNVQTIAIAKPAPVESDEQQATSAGASYSTAAQVAESVNIGNVTAVADVALQDAESRLDHVPHQALRGETTSVQHVDTAAYEPGDADEALIPTGDAELAGEVADPDDVQPAG